MATVAAVTESATLEVSIQRDVERAIDELMAWLPSLERVSSDQRRGIIARYSSVLEGNFIYWMTGAYLATSTDAARSNILENLNEEVRDSHPRMLRTFTLAAHALPTDHDAMAVQEDLTKVRLFVGKLSGVPILVMMAFFEGFIQRFMAYLADLAAKQGSSEFEYTDVHGVCDIAHTEGLFRSLAAELAFNPPPAGTDLFEGMNLLNKLIRTIVDPSRSF